MFDAHIFPLEDQFAQDFQFMDNWLYLTKYLSRLFRDYARDNYGRHLPT